MLKSEVVESVFEVGRVIVMSDLAIVAASAKSTCQEIAKQAHALGTGLANAAPGDKMGTPNNSVQYLLDTAESLQKVVDEISLLMTASNTPPPGPSF